MPRSLQHTDDLLEENEDKTTDGNNSSSGGGVDVSGNDTSGRGSGIEDEDDLICWKKMKTTATKVVLEEVPM
jgi:hypothetical protein